MSRRQLQSKKNINYHHQYSLKPAPPDAFACSDPDYELKDRLKNLLMFEEGRVVLKNGLHVAYRDSKGIYTIGYGFNLQTSAATSILQRVTTKTVTALMHKSEFLTEVEAQGLLLIAEDNALDGVRTYLRDYAMLDLPRRVVFAAMVYQFGAVGFGKFHRLIAGVEGRNWPSVVLSMRQSQWYRRDSPKRARRMADAVEKGVFPDAATLSDTAAATGTPPTASTANAPRSSWPFDN